MWASVFAIVNSPFLENVFLLFPRYYLVSFDFNRKGFWEAQWWWVPLPFIWECFNSPLLFKMAGKRYARGRRRRGNSYINHFNSVFHWDVDWIQPLPYFKHFKYIVPLDFAFGCCVRNPTKVLVSIESYFLFSCFKCTGLQFQLIIYCYCVHTIDFCQLILYLVTC